MVMWGGLTTTVLMIILIALLARLQRRQEHGYARRPTTLDCARLVSEALALDEQATASLEAAQRAATTYEQIALDLAMTEAEREAAWQAHSEAAAAHSAASAAQAGLPIEQSIPDPLQREISSAARAAYRRGEITVEELRAVWQKVDGWDQEREDRSTSCPDCAPRRPRRGVATTPRALPKTPPAAPPSWPKSPPAPSPKKPPTPPAAQSWPA